MRNQQRHLTVQLAARTAVPRHRRAQSLATIRGGGRRRPLVLFPTSVIFFPEGKNPATERVLCLCVPGTAANRRFPQTAGHFPAEFCAGHYGYGLRGNRSFETPRVISAGRTASMWRRSTTSCNRPRPLAARRTESRRPALWGCRAAATARLVNAARI
jgi:hypothetical protein